MSENPRNFTVEYSCANGCRDGKCLVAPIGKCDNLITKIKKSEDYKFQDIDFKSTWSGSYEFDEWWGDESHNGIAYQSSWNAYSEGKSYYLDYNVLVFNEENVDLNEWLKQRTSYQVCQITSHWNEDKENYYYICNWDVLRNEQNTNNYNYQTRQIFWANKNIAVQVYVYTGKYLSDEEVLMISQKRLNDVLSSFIDNEMKYISWENFDFDWLLRGQIIDNFEDCPSEVKLFVNNETNSTCWPSWNCKIEPVICPPHGFQKKTCIDYSCNQEIREEQIYCSPGICSGCVVPRWLDSKGDNKCIPYGFRFEQLVGWESKLIEDTGEDSLKEGEYGDVSLKVLSDKEAVLTLYGRDGKAYDYTLVLGESVEIIIPGWDEDIDSIKLYVKKIFYSEDSAISSYIEFSATVSGWQKVEKTINAYCDIDGEVKQQKGDWDKCMNSYECDSNLCSGRECTAINAMIKEVSGYKTLGVKVLCKIADVFGIEDYYVCLTGYLGDDYLKTSSSSSGGAGGGSSGSSSSK